MRASQERPGGRRCAGDFKPAETLCPTRAIHPAVVLSSLTTHLALSADAIVYMRRAVLSLGSDVVKDNSRDEKERPG